LTMRGTKICLLPNGSSSASTSSTIGTSRSILDIIQTSFSNLKKALTGEVMWLSPRQEQELIDSRIALLALTQHKLRNEARSYRQDHPQTQLDPLKYSSQIPSTASSSSWNTFATEANYYKELAIEKLENEGAERLGVDGLRNEIQTLLHEQTLKLFESFRSAELILNPSETIGREEDSLHDPSRAGGGGALRLSQGKEQRQQLHKLGYVENACKPILLKDFTTLGKLHELQYVPFRERKRQYMLQIMKLQKWENYFTFDEDSSNDAGGQTDGIYDKSNTMEQILMLAKRIVLKNDLGYSLIQLPSTIPNAGRGLFVDEILKGKGCTIFRTMTTMS
jgi:hypothetical protein